MSANLLDIFTAQGARELAVMESAYHPERRKRARTQVHWRVLLLREGDAEGIVDTVTQNLSSSGFYCFSPVPLTPGESLLCTLKVPAYDPKGEERTLTLECTVVVTRAETAADGFYGIACHIEDYHLSTSIPRTA
jgi:PilZ domain